MLGFQNTTSEQTIQQGLQEYWQSSKILYDMDTLPAEARHFFLAHDVTHIVFGCDSSEEQEAINDVWSMFGTTLTVREYFSFLKIPEVGQIVQDASKLGLVWTSVKALPHMASAFRRARQMTKKWPFHEYQRYLERPISQVREEFNIRPLSRN